jgi:hypothetical protein
VFFFGIVFTVVIVVPLANRSGINKTSYPKNQSFWFRRIFSSFLETVFLCNGCCVVLKVKTKSDAVTFGINGDKI